MLDPYAAADLTVAQLAVEPVDDLLKLRLKMKRAKLNVGRVQLAINVAIDRENARWIVIEREMIVELKKLDALLGMTIGGQIAAEYEIGEGLPRGGRPPRL